MTQPAHQVFDRRARGGSERLAGVPQVVEPEPRHTHLGSGANERLSHRIAPHRRAGPIAGDEDAPAADAEGRTLVDAALAVAGAELAVRLLGLEGWKGRSVSLRAVQHTCN
ncbi:hypothetical protein GCM10010199_33630 [Dactylosporangium roseum]